MEDGTRKSPVVDGVMGPGSLGSLRRLGVVGRPSSQSPPTSPTSSAMASPPASPTPRGRSTPLAWRPERSYVKSGSMLIFHRGRPGGLRLAAALRHPSRPSWAWSTPPIDPSHQRHRRGFELHREFPSRSIRHGHLQGVVYALFVVSGKWGQDQTSRRPVRRRQPRTKQSSSSLPKSPEGGRGGLHANAIRERPLATVTRRAVIVRRPRAAS